MKKKVIIGVSAALVVILAAVGIWFFGFRGQSGSASKDLVYVTKVSSLLNIGSAMGYPNRFAGVVEPQQTLEIQQNQERIIKEVLVEEGQQVAVGTPLFTYDTEQSESDLSQAQLDLERIANEIANARTQIATLQSDKKKASADEQLSYTTQIQTAEMDMKRSEYEQKSKQMEIEKLQSTINNSTVSSEIAGIVQTINDGSDPYSNSTAFITILETGTFRIKGTINEQNMGALNVGDQVIVHARNDENKTWTGTVGKIDLDRATGNASNMMYGNSSGEETQSNNYPFYVDLTSDVGLMLGQHVYVEPDLGQTMEKAGIWLSDYLIADIDTDPYVWADNGKGQLEKRPVVLGQYDENMMEYEIVEGLTEDDAITFPEDSLVEGALVEVSSDGMMGKAFSEEDMMMEDGMTDEDMMMEDGMTDEDMMMEDGMMDEGMTDEGTSDEALPEDDLSGSVGNSSGEQVIQGGSGTMTMGGGGATSSFRVG